ncbi:MAG: CRTAC1 family protein, partial [Acidobacteria bacterium]|nr:CRTAC1 family protein [Acidobacteriota bacterium]
MTSASGVEFAHRTGRDDSGRPAYFMPEIMGSGVALFDRDGDGDLDLYLVQGEGTDRLFENRGPGIRFVEMAGVPGAAAYGRGVAAGDADGDGDLDLFRTGYGPDALLLNSGDSG